MATWRSRRDFMRYSTGTAALLLSEGCGVRGKPVTTTAATNVAPQRVEPGLVVKPTPAFYFTSRDAGAREMHWGPVSTYGDTVPNDRFYVHNRARPPTIDVRAWRLEVTGDAIGRARSFTFDELLALPQVALRRQLDCGANCRAFFPKLPPRSSDSRWLPIGFTQWHFGATGVADWVGVRLKDVLEAAGLGRAVEVQFTGLDAIAVGDGNTAPYSEVIPIEKVLESDTLLVHRMNGEALPVDHGFPVRAIFSGWGANAAVKWLGHIRVSSQPLPRGPFQANQIIEGPDIPKPYSPTVGPVRSAMEIDEGVTLAPGDITLRGRAWSGAGPIARVDVMVEKLVAPGVWKAVWEPSWRQAQLLGKAEPKTWVRFEVPWATVDPGVYRIMSRAGDQAGHTQPRPEDVVWNQEGLDYNGHAPLEVLVLPPHVMP